MLTKEELAAIDALVHLRAGFTRHDHYVRSGHSVAFYSYKGGGRGEDRAALFPMPTDAADADARRDARLRQELSGLGVHRASGRV